MVFEIVRQRYSFWMSVQGKIRSPLLWAKNGTAKVSLISGKKTGFLFALRMRCHQIIKPIDKLANPIDIVNGKKHNDKIETGGWIIPRLFGKGLHRSRGLHPRRPRQPKNRSIHRIQPTAKKKNDLKFPTSKADIHLHGNFPWASFQSRLTIPIHTLTTPYRLSDSRRPMLLVEDIFVSLF